MITKLYSVLDLATDTFGTPILIRSEPEAVRAFTIEALRDGSVVAAAPGDYALYCLGHFEHDSGALIPDRQRVLTAVQAIASAAASGYHPNRRVFDLPRDGVDDAPGTSPVTPLP